MKYSAITLFFSFALAACSGESDDALGTSRSGLDSALVEGQACPPEKCEGEAIATAADGTTPDPASYHCVAGPQVGSGVGVCHLALK